MTSLGNRVVADVISRGHTNVGWTLHQATMTGVLIKKGTLALEDIHKGTMMWRQEEDGCLQTGERGTALRSPRQEPTGTWILDFQFPEPRGIGLLLVKPPVRDASLQQPRPTHPNLL